MAEHDHGALELEPGEDLMEAIKRAFKKAVAPEPVSVEPSLTGPAGRVWEAPVAKMRANAAAESGDFDGRDGMISAWIVEAPKEGEPVHSYWVSLADLSEARGDEIIRKGATHELVVFQMTPGHPRDLVLVDAERADTMQNPIYAAQLICSSHDEAKSVMGALLRDFVDGKVHPADEEAMIARFGEDNIRAEARDAKRIAAAKDRFEAAKTGIEVGAAIVVGLEPANGAPAMLRAGLDLHGASTRAVLKLLVEKGLLTKAEITEAVAAEAEDEVKRYERDAGLPRTVKLNARQAAD